MPLVAEEVSLAIVRSVKGVAGRIRKQDADLARQLRRAVNSVALNVSEGERRVGRDAIHLFNVAAGSAKEVQTCLRSAQQWGYVTEGECAETLRHVDRELGLLWGLTRKKK